MSDAVDNTTRTHATRPPPPPPPPARNATGADATTTPATTPGTDAPAAQARPAAPALAPAQIEGAAHAQQAAGERASSTLTGGERPAGAPPEPPAGPDAAQAPSPYQPEPAPSTSAEQAALAPTTAEGRAAVAAALAQSAGLSPEQAWRASQALDPARIAQRQTQIQTALMNTRPLPEGGIDTASGRVTYSPAEREALAGARSSDPAARERAVQTAQDIAARSAREHALDTAFGGPEGRQRVEAAHRAMTPEQQRNLDQLGRTTDQRATQPGFGQGFRDGAYDALTGLVDGVRAAYDLATNPEARQRLNDVLEALNNPATRDAVLDAFREHAGAAMEEFLARGEEYVAGYLAGSAAAGLGIGRLGRYGAGLLSDGVVNAARRALDIARRAEVRPDGLGANGGNISVRLRPHTQSVDPARDRIPNLERLSPRDRRLLAANPIDNPRAFTTDFLKAGPHVKPTGTNAHIQITVRDGNIVLSSSQATADQVRAASLRLRGDPQFRARLIAETEAGLAQHGRNMTPQRVAEARALVAALRRMDAN